MKLLLENWRKYLKESEASELLSESKEIAEGEKGWRERVRDIVLGSNWQSQEEYEASQDKKATDAKAQRAKAARDPLAGKTYRMMGPKDFELSPAPPNVKDWRGNFLYVSPDQIPDDVLVNPDTGETAKELYDRMNSSSDRDIQTFMGNKGGQMLGGLKDYDGDGHISDAEAEVQEFEHTDEKTGLRILPLRWSVAYGVLLDRWGESPE